MYNDSLLRFIPLPEENLRKSESNHARGAVKASLGSRGTGLLSEISILNLYQIHVGRIVGNHSMMVLWLYVYSGLSI
jgi:hypothetical protein